MFAIFGLTVLLGICLVYPTYFWYLNEFRRVLVRDHEEVWRSLRSSTYGADVQVAYRALQLSGKGSIDGIELSEDARVVRGRTVKLLYIGVMLFMTFLGIGLFDAFSAGND